MKVTVCFGNVRVVVPCGQEDMLVCDLIQQATVRYRKATNKPIGSWVIVRALRCASGGGILDPDDRLADVADDRECIVASYEEDSVPSEIHPGRPGDGTSASSTGSPDLIDEVELPKAAIEVTGSTPGDTKLQVRHGSEPALNCLSSSPASCPGSPKRWSATLVCREEPRKSLESAPMEVTHRHSESQSSAMASSFSRDSNRLSVQFAINGGSAIQRWMDSAERALALTERKEPVGASTSNSAASSAVSQGDDRWEEIVLSGGSGPLGIHVVPAYDTEGEGRGLLVQGVEPGGKVHSFGTLHPGDTITHVNGTHLAGVTFQRAQEIFREALSVSELRLGVTKQEISPSCAQGQRPVKKEKEDVLVEGMERLVGGSPSLAMVSPTKRGADVSSQRSLISHPSIIVANTRRIGRKMEIDLVKGPHGLGFSVTTRDNPAGGNCPIYIKNILPKGAAIDDGRLRPGDRLLEVNDVEITGKCQSEAVALLRSVPSSGSVHLVVSRQEREADRSRSPQLPREIVSQSNMPAEKVQEEGQPFPWKHREVMDLAIPVNDTETAGLGVSVKGKTATCTNSSGCNDLGIFVKSVLHGGAASRDGRLLPNDQLLRINGVPLLGLANAIAMETLRRAMQKEGPVPGAITLTIARRMPSPGNLLNGSAESFGCRSEGEADTSTTSEASEGTAIFLPPNQMEDRQENKLGVLDTVRNPVVDRLTGQNPFRNESYYRATHETWSTSMWQPILPTDSSHNQKDNHIIEETHPLPKQNTSGKMSYVDPNSIEESRKPVKEESGEPVTDTTTSLEEQSGGFLRDAFGRQSMSEKRHATLDARSTDTYQRNKRLREERERQQRHTSYSSEHYPNERPEQQIVVSAEEPHPVTQRLAGLQGILTGTQLRPPRMAAHTVTRAASVESLLDLNRIPVEHAHHNRRSQRERDGGDRREHRRRTYDIHPVSVIKKSASLESLQTLIQEGSEESAVHCFRVPTNPSVSSRVAVAVSRGRGCNESFRAAVDRSYDGDMQDGMDPLAEEETESAMSTVWGRGLVESKKARKKGLLKGLGSILKFGKQRKGDPPKLTEAALKQQQMALERAEAHRQARAEREKIQEQYCRLAGHEVYLGREPPIIQSHWNNRPSDTIHVRTRSQDAFVGLARPGSRVGVADPRRAGHYVNYEEIQHHLSKRWQQLSSQHWKPQSNNNTGPPDTSRWQQQYHSQRYPPRDRDRDCGRPTSGFYEYESVIRGRSQRGHGSLPRKHHALPGSNV